LDVQEIGRGELALASMLDWNLWVGREEEVAAVRADAASAVPPVPAKPTWFYDLTSKREPAPVPAMPPTPAIIASWRAAVHQQSPEAVSPPTAAPLGGPYITVSPDSVSVSRDTPALGHNEVMSSSQLRNRSCDRVSVKSFSFSSMSPSHTMSSGVLGAHTQGSSSTILSSCLPGLTLDGRSDWDGSASVSGISPNSWVLVGGPEVQVMKGVAEEVEDSSSTTGSQSYNPKKRGSPLAADSLTQAQTACSHDWVDPVDHRQKKRKVGAVAVGGTLAPGSYIC
jgi:hypothetical protein